MDTKSLMADLTLLSLPGFWLNYMTDKKNRTTAQRESDLFITSMITDQIGRQEVLSIYRKNYNFRDFPKLRHAVSLT